MMDYESVVKRLMAFVLTFTLIMKVKRFWHTTHLGGSALSILIFSFARGRERTRCSTARTREPGSDRVDIEDAKRNWC